MKLVPTLLVASLAVSACGFMQAQVDYNGTAPWSQTASSGPDAPVGGWWYNLGVTGLRVELLPNAPKHLLVQYVFPGSPAAGVVLPGDILTAAGGVSFVEDHQDGYGRAVFGARGPIGEFATALELAQEASSGGVLAVTIDRAGSALDLSIPVGTTYGSFGPTFPGNCPKSELVRAELLDYLVSTQGANGSWGSPVQDTFAPLALLSSDDPVHRASVLACANYHADTTVADLDNSHGLVNWRYMAAGIVLAEYYLLTQEQRWLPELQEIHDFIIRSQYLDRSQVSPQVQFSHPQSVPTTAEEQHGGWGHNGGFEGYGPIAMLTGQGALVLALMDRCQISVRRKRLDAAYDFLKRGTGSNGYLWYLDEVASNTGWADVGRTGASALANFLSPYPESRYKSDGLKHTSLLGEHPQSFPDTHGSPPMGMGYAAAALAFDPTNFRKQMDANRYWFALAQCFDGSYYYQPNRDNAGYGSDSRIVASAITAFVFSIPRHNLVITGRR